MKNTKKFKVILARRADGMLLKHLELLRRMGFAALKKFRDEFEYLLRCLGENPMQFSLEEELHLPEGAYRSALFANRYKAIFLVEGDSVYLDAILDCRQNPFNQTRDT